MLGIFPLVDGQPFYTIGNSRALGPAFRRGEAVRRSLADLKSNSQEVLHGAVHAAFYKTLTVADGGVVEANSSSAAIQKQIRKRETLPEGWVGEEDGTSLKKDKTVVQNLCKVTSDGFDRYRKQKGIRVEEADFTAISMAFSDRVERKALSAESDTLGRANSAGFSKESAWVVKAGLGERNPGGKANSSHLYQAQTSTLAEKLKSNKESSILTLNNSFQPLFVPTTCYSADPILFPPLKGLGLESLRSKAQPMKEMDNNLQYKGPFVFFSGSDRVMSPRPTKSDFQDPNYYKTKPMSTGLCSIRAHSEPMTYYNCFSKGTRKMKHFRPKNYRNFTKGQIMSWEDFEYHGNLEKKKDAVANGNSLAKEIQYGKNVLKVYSRN